MKKQFQEFMKFCIIGGTSTLVNYLVFFTMLYLFKFDSLTAFFFGYIAGFIFSFKFNKKLTFKSDNKTLPEILKYLGIYIFSLFFGLSLFKMLALIIKTEPTIKFIIVISITTLINFLGSKYIVFKKTETPKIFFHPLFSIVLLLKILFSAFFASDFLLNGTIPFAKYFVESGFSNPYDHFLNLGQLKAFPYSAAMLISVAFPQFLLYFLPTTILENIHLQMMITRIPLLIADIGIFYILLKLLKTKEKETMLYYWCSPIIFYISYFHGQLDAIPIFFLITAIFFLLTEKYKTSGFLLGLALSAKANIFVSIPFIALYLLRNKQGSKKIIEYFSITIITYTAFILPFILSKGYQTLVLHAEEQFWVFLLQTPLGTNGVTLYIVPLALLTFFLRLTFFRKINQDALLMSIAVSFAIIIALVPPRPGWFFWAIPFLAYFFTKNELVSKTNYLLINVFFLLYFLIFSPSSDIFESFQTINTTISNTPNIHLQLLQIGINADFTANIVYSALIAIIIIIIYFIYKFGLITNLTYKNTGLTIGIAGDSGSGKSYTSRLIEDLVGEKNLTILEGDDLHKWERNHPNWQKLTHLNPKSNMLHKEIEYLEGIENSKKLKRKEYNHITGKFSKEKPVWPKKFILVSGLHSFYLSKMRNLIDIKIYLNPEEKLIKYWKIKRDTQERGYSKKTVLENIEARKKDSKKFLDPQLKFADLIFRLKPLEKISNTQEEIEKKLTAIIDNSFNSSQLLDELAEISSMKTDIEFNDDLETIELSFSGKINSLEIAKIGYNLVPNLEELLENRTTKWHADLNGIMQLIILQYVSEKLKNNKEQTV